MADRLISADALKDRFSKREEWLRLDVHDKYSLGLYHGCATDKELIGEIPTVDAVPVVRCKDCKHYNVFRLECHNSHMNGCIGIDGFCSYGERRTDERKAD